MKNQNKRPVIGVVPGFAGPDMERKFAQAGRVNFADLNYLESVESAGGLPLVVPYVRDMDALEQYCGMVDGVLFIGGADVAAERYGQESLPSEYPAIPERDNFEFTLLEMAMERGLPVLGICRGIQLVNIALGGTLIQDIPSMRGSIHHFQAPGVQEIAHAVRLEPDSQLARVLGERDVDVNSFHHQCIDRLGAGLCATGHSEEGLIEAVEHESYPYMIAVQWHPERMRHDERQRRLFANFVEVCAEVYAG